MSLTSDDLVGLGTVLTGVGTLLTALLGFRNRSAIRGVAKTTNATHEEVRSLNGKTGVQLIEEGEGRRARAIPQAQRTESEQHYVDSLKEGESNDRN